MAKKQKKSRSNNIQSETMNNLMMDALMEYIPDSIYFKDLKSRIIRANRACTEKAYGVCVADEAVGKTDFDFFSEEHAKQAYKDEQRIIKTGKPIVDIEEKETWYGKKSRWISSTKMPFYDKNGNIIGTFGISRDISDRKKAII